jgi:hypothetical protein
MIVRFCGLWVNPAVINVTEGGDGVRRALRDDP